MVAECQKKGLNGSYLRRGEKKIEKAAVGNKAGKGPAIIKGRHRRITRVQSRCLQGIRTYIMCSRSITGNDINQYLENALLRLLLMTVR